MRAERPEEPPPTASSVAELLLASVGEVAAISDPVDRAVRIADVGQRLGGLPGPLIEARRTALIEARRAGHTCAALGERMRLSKQRIHQITSAKPTPQPLTEGTPS